MPNIAKQRTIPMAALNDLPTTLEKVTHRQEPVVDLSNPEIQCPMFVKCNYRSAVKQEWGMLDIRKHRIYRQKQCKYYVLLSVTDTSG